MYAVQRLDHEGQVQRREEFEYLSTAVKRYTRSIRRYPGTHVQVVEIGGLPGMEDRIIAQYFDTRKATA